VSHARLTVRARLTVLYTSLFALCGAAVVGVSYSLVAQLGTSEPDPQPSSRTRRPSERRALCQSGKLHSDGPAIARCNAALQQLGALQAAFEGQRRFIANASHELRARLAVIGSTVDVVAGNPDSTPDDLRAMATEVRAAADHAKHLVGALLILARNERGLSVHEEVDLATVAEDVLDTARLWDVGVRLSFEPPPYRATRCWLR